MPSGSCLCGAIKYEYDGDVSYAACHCLPCRKSSGTPTSHNFLLPEDKFKVQGDLKTWKRVGDSGQPVTYYFCPDCPTLIYVAGDAIPGTIILKAGTLDGEEIAQTEPAMELYTKRRLPWLDGYGKAQQFETGPA